jgi:hypothetical protein
MVVWWIILMIILCLLRYLIKWNYSSRALAISTEVNREDDDVRT